MEGLDGAPSLVEMALPGTYWAELGKVGKSWDKFCLVLEA